MPQKLANGTNNFTLHRKQMFNNNGVTNNEVTAGSAASAFNESPGSPPRTTTNRQPASIGTRGSGRSGSRQGSPRRRLRRDVPPALGRQSPPLVLLPLLYGPLYPVPFLPFFSRLLLPLLKLKLDRLFGQQSRIMEERKEERGRVEGGSRN